MGVLIILDVVPQRIDPEVWEATWGEIRTLWSAHPARLLGHDWVTVAGVPLAVYTRSIERDPDDPTARRLTLAGDRTAMSAGAQQTIFRDLGRYAARCPGDAEPPDDILFAGAGIAARRSPPSFPVPTTPRAHGSHVRDGMVQVLGDEPCTGPCAIPLLAAAMLLEARLPRQAMVHGEIDREQAEAARRWAESVLGPERPIALPVRVDAWRLVERLGVELRGQALVRAVDRLHLAAPAKKESALIAIFGHAEADTWWLDRLRAAGGARDRRPPDEARSLVAAYLEATRDPARVLGLACLDGRGPRWSPDAFVELLAALPPVLDGAAIERALGVVFGAGGERLAAIHRARVAARAEGSAATRAPDDHDAPAISSSPAELDAATREEVLATARAARGIGQREGARDAAALRSAIAAALAQRGPTLTEDAWEWIGREDDAGVLRFLLALAELADHRPRRALFENRALCQWAFEAAADADQRLGGGAPTPIVSKSPAG